MTTEVEKAWILWEQLGLVIGWSGCPIYNLDNVLRVLEKWPPVRGLVWIDKTSKRILTRDFDGVARKWTREDEARLALRFQRELRLHRTSPGLIAQAVRLHVINQAHADDDII